MGVGLCCVTRQPGPRAVTARMIQRIGTVPRPGHGAVVYRRTVAVPRPVERLRQDFVQVRARDVEVGPVDVAVQGRAHDGYRLGRTIEPQQCFPELVVDASEAVGWRMDRLAQLADCFRIAALGDEQHAANVMVRAAIATVVAALPPELHGVSEPPEPNRVSGSCHRHREQRVVPRAVPGLDAWGPQGLVPVGATSQDGYRGAQVARFQRRNRVEEIVRIPSRESARFVSATLIAQQDRLQPATVACFAWEW